MLAVNHDEARRLFEGHGFFGQLSPTDLDTVLSHGWAEHHSVGHQIFAKGSPGRSMMAVLRGSIKISSPSPTGREVMLAVINAGEIFGEMALLDGGERTADATAGKGFAIDPWASLVNSRPPIDGYQTTCPYSIHLPRADYPVARPTSWET